MTLETSSAPPTVLPIEADEARPGRTGDGIESLVALLKHQRRANRLVNRTDPTDTDDSAESAF